MLFTQACYCRNATNKTANTDSDFFLSRTRFLAETVVLGDSYNASQWLPAKKSYTIDHNILRSWLEHVVGIKGTALEWFQSYLADDFVSSLAPFHLESLKARSLTLCCFPAYAPIVVYSQDI